MRAIAHLAAIAFGIAAPAAVTFWSVSDSGPRNAAHYARVAAENPTTRSVVEAFVGRANDSLGGSQRTIHRIIVEGEFAAVHQQVQHQPDEPGMEVVDIFRVVDGKVVEHRDVMQPIPADSSNVNGAF